MSRCHYHTKIQDCGDVYLVWYQVGCVFFTLQGKKIQSSSVSQSYRLLTNFRNWLTLKVNRQNDQSPCTQLDCKLSSFLTLSITFYQYLATKSMPKQRAINEAESQIFQAYIHIRNNGLNQMVKSFLICYYFSTYDNKCI